MSGALRLSSSLSSAHHVRRLKPSGFSPPRTLVTATSPLHLQEITPSEPIEHASPPQADTSSSTSAAAAPPPQKLGFWQNLVAQGKDKHKLAQLGFGAFCAYGVISNLNAVCMITLAWLTVVRTTGLTPLAPGNWPAFLGVYGGLLLTSNLLRPIRLSLAIAVAPRFDSGLVAIMKWTGQENKFAAFGIMLLMIAVGTISAVVLAVAAFGGFPNIGLGGPSIQVS